MTPKGLQGMLSTAIAKATDERRKTYTRQKQLKWLTNCNYSVFLITQPLMPRVCSLRSTNCLFSVPLSPQTWSVFLKPGSAQTFSTLSFQFLTPNYYLLCIVMYIHSSIHATFLNSIPVLELLLVSLCLWKTKITVGSFYRLPKWQRQNDIHLLSSS